MWEKRKRPPRAALDHLSFKQSADIGEKDGVSLFTIHGATPTRLVKAGHLFLA